MPLRPLLLVVCILLVGGCSRCGLQPDPGVKIVVPAMPTTLDWSYSDPTSWTNYPVLLATMKGLTALGPAHQVEPGLAERWTRERTMEGRERYVFHLREDVRWSDGTTPLVAEDFVFAWRRAIQGQERGELSDLIGAEEVLALQARGASEAELTAGLERLGVRALDSHTLEVVLVQPRSYFLARLANVYLFFPAPSTLLAGRAPEALRDYFDRPGEGHPLALGPYRVETWDRPGERVRLVKNEASAFPAGPDAPPVLTLLRSEVGPALYERGRVDFVFVDSAIALRGAQPADLERRPLLSTYFLAFNTEREGLEDAQVRRAISQALERGALLEGLLPEARATHTLLPPELPGFSQAGAGLPVFDREAARAVLAGKGKLKRSLRLVHRSGDSFVPETAIAERIASQLRAVGVTVEIDARSDFSDELRRRGPDGKRTWDLHVRRLGADYSHPNTFFTLFERTGNHQTGWERLEGGEAQARFMKLLDQADAEPDPDRAATLYAEAQRVLVGEQAIIAPLYHPDRYFRVRGSLTGLTVSPFNFLSLETLGRSAQVKEAR